MFKTKKKARKESPPTLAENSIRFIGSLFRQYFPSRLILATATVATSFSIAGWVDDWRRKKSEVKHLQDKVGLIKKNSPHYYLYYPEAYIDTWPEIIFNFSYTDEIYTHLTHFTEAHITLYGAYKILSRYPKVVNYINYFIINTPQSSSLTVLTSPWLHLTIPHLLLNTVALWSFGPVLSKIWDNPLFLGFYASSGVITSLGSTWAQKFQTSTKRIPTSPTGTIYSIIGALAAISPTFDISFMSHEFNHFPVRYAACGLLLVDILGIFKGWRYVDHFGNILGTVYGYSFASFLKENFYDKRSFRPITFYQQEDHREQFLLQNHQKKPTMKMEIPKAKKEIQIDLSKYKDDEDL